MVGSWNRKDTPQGMNHMYLKPAWGKPTYIPTDLWSDPCWAASSSGSDAVLYSWSTVMSEQSYRVFGEAVTQHPLGHIHH